MLQLLLGRVDNHLAVNPVNDQQVTSLDLLGSRIGTDNHRQGQGLGHD